MAIKETAETWIRMDLFCDGLDGNGICVFGASDEQRISEVAPIAEGARKAILNAAIKACWRFDPKLQRWLCPECVRARHASAQPADVAMTDGPPSVPQSDHTALESLAIAP
jgi:hypothetical protein